MFEHVQIVWTIEVLKHSDYFENDLQKKKQEFNFTKYFSVSRVLT